MKLNRTSLFIIISSLALAFVLFVQVSWLFQTAQTKEELFTEKANIVLSRTTDALVSDTSACKKIEACVDANASGQAAPLGQAEIRKLDSLFNHYMDFYDFHVNYSFVVAKPQPSLNTQPFSTIAPAGEPQACYENSLDELAGRSGWELQMLFPEKKQFIMAEMSTLFVTSVLLILVVIIMFRQTVRSLLKEKRISEHSRDFLNNMTHEFKTPLTNISLAGKMIVKDSNIGQEEKIRHYSGIILEENEKLRLQVEQVLSMTALERDELPLQKTELDVHQLIRDSLKCISIQIESRQGSIHLDLTAQHVVIMGDKTHLTNALCNLVDNAIKYSPGKPDLSVQTYNSAAHVIITFSDKGIGIEKEYQKKVFDKFFRVPTGDVHDVKGFGLGLAYVKKIVELHGGTIELQSEKGKGTTFILTLPHV